MSSPLFTIELTLFVVSLFFVAPIDIFLPKFFFSLTPPYYATILFFFSPVSPTSSSLLQQEKAGKPLTPTQGALLQHVVNVLAKYFIADGNGLAETHVRVRRKRGGNEKQGCWRWIDGEFSV